MSIIYKIADEFLSRIIAWTITTYRHRTIVWIQRGITSRGSFQFGFLARTLPIIPLVYVMVLNATILLNKDFLPEEKIDNVFGHLQVVTRLMDENLELSSKSGGHDRVIYCQDGWKQGDLTFYSPLIGTNEKRTWELFRNFNSQTAFDVVFLSIRSTSDYARKSATPEIKNQNKNDNSGNRTSIVYDGGYVERLTVGKLGDFSDTIISQQIHNGKTSLSIDKKIEFAWIGASHSLPSTGTPKSNLHVIGLRGYEEQDSIGRELNEGNLSCANLKLDSERSISKGIMLVDLGHIFVIGWNTLYGIVVSLLLVIFVEVVARLLREAEAESGETGDV